MVHKMFMSHVYGCMHLLQHIKHDDINMMLNIKDMDPCEGLSTLCLGVY